MASDLRERLDDLAARTAHGVAPTDLWDRGVRRRRLAQATMASVVAFLILLAGAAGLARHLSPSRIEPAAPQGARQLPDRFYWQPSPWLPSFDGPPGPLVLVFPTVRRTVTHTENGLVGVTGSSGAYGFLELPADAVLGANGSAGVALSPNGRRLAFWVSGTPAGAPNTTLLDGSTVTGVGMYDTVTGRTRLSRIPTVHGLEPSLLLWSDDSTLVLSYGQILAGDGGANSSTAHFDATALWDTTAPRPTVLPTGSLPGWSGNYATRATAGTLVMPRGHHRWLMLDPHRPDAGRPFSTDQPSSVLVLSSDLRRVVGVPDTGSDAGPLAVAEIPPADARGPARLRQIPAGHDWFRPLAWVDATHVAALRRVVVSSPDSGPQVVGEIDLVDVRTGELDKLVSEFGAGGSNGSDGWMASSYFAAPVVHATPPPSPWNRRTLAFGLLVTLVLGVTMLGAVVRRTRGRRA